MLLATFVTADKSSLRRGAKLSPSETKKALAPGREIAPAPAAGGGRKKDRRGRSFVFFGLRGSLSFALQLLEHGGEFGRQGAVELHRFAGAGMDEAQAGGVEALAGEAGDRLFGAVDRVSQDGVADVGHVDTDLVGAAGLQAAAQVVTPG